jgi:hypothetical protein
LALLWAVHAALSWAALHHLLRVTAMHPAAVAVAAAIV